MELESTCTHMLSGVMLFAMRTVSAVKFQDRPLILNLNFFPS